MSMTHLSFREFIGDVSYLCRLILRIMNESVFYSVGSNESI